MYFYLKISALVTWFGLAAYDYYLATGSDEGTAKLISKATLASEIPWWRNERDDSTNGKSSKVWEIVRTVVFLPPKLVFGAVAAFIGLPAMGCLGFAQSLRETWKTATDETITLEHDSYMYQCQEEGQVRNNRGKWRPMLNVGALFSGFLAFTSWIYYSSYRFFFPKTEVKIVEVEPERTIGEQWNNVLSNTWEKPKEFLGSTTGKVVAGTAAVAAIAGGYALVKALRAGKATKTDETVESSEEKTTSKRSSKSKQKSTEKSSGYWTYGLIALGMLFLLVIAYFGIRGGNTEPEQVPDLENGLLR